MNLAIALFGESEKGEFRTGYFCKTLHDLSKYLGEPPSGDCKGLIFAIQALLFEREILFFRVHEEGFSVNDYLKGLSLLEKQEGIPQVAAICLPGVGNGDIIDATTPICQVHKSFLIVSEIDLFDYLTFRREPL